MSSRRGGGRSSFAAVSTSSPKGKSTIPSQGNSSGSPGGSCNNLPIDQMSQEMSGTSIDTAADGDWEVFSKKSKNRPGTGAAKQWGPQNSAPIVGAAGNGGAWKNFGRKSAGRGNNKPQSSNTSWESADMAPAPPIPPTLQHGWQWQNRAGSSPSKAVKDAQEKDSDFSKHFPHGSVGEDDSGSEKGGPHQGDLDNDDGLDMLEDSDDDILSDDFDSDGSVKSHGTRKKNKWFEAFFDEIDKLRIEEVTEPSRQWHCPACRNGPGSIDWYRGLQPLMAHAKTKGASRVKVHRELAELLEEELSRRGASLIPAGEVFGKWKGLRGSVSDHEIVWPPMIIVMNTKLEQDDNGKWLGMGNQELLDYFNGYKAVKARHSYGPLGHRGMSVLIFEGSAIGYLEAERLHKHFSEQGRDRDAWDRRRQLFYPGGQRQLYGYMAHKEDVDSFNQHCHGKSRLKYDMRSYIEMVVEPMKQMSEDNQQLVWFKNVATKEQSKSKAFKESFDAVTEKLRETMEENRIVRQRTKMQHEQNKEEMDLQEQFYKDQITTLYQTLEEKERDFEVQLQKDRKKVKESNVESRTKEERKLREEEIARFIETQDKGVEEFEAKRTEMTKMLDEKITDMKQKHMGEELAMKRRHREEELVLEKEFTDLLTKLMEQYAPHPSQDATGASTNP
ncbi:hypothetical protein Scep_003001 [Stephania cephalantha]|uniref:Uncharacterized protein n=1 Tax=Stephania cephalantha TaxID=152367 RepID=A0AAP0LC25_9MAGN